MFNQLPEHRILADQLVQPDIALIGGDPPERCKLQAACESSSTPHLNRPSHTNEFGGRGEHARRYRHSTMAQLPLQMAKSRDGSAIK
jgi:hypothetical protein